MANRDLEKRNPDPEVDHSIWRELPAELVEKCLGHLPVLTIASKLREVNKAWHDYPGTPAFMKLHNHGKNLNSSFGFLMHNKHLATNRCETMILNHEALKWQMAPSLPLHDHHSKCKVESVSEGLILLRLLSDTSWSFIVWNPLLRCEQAVPGISLAYSIVNLVVDRATGIFKIVAFNVLFRDCLTYTPTRGSWQSPVNYERPVIYNDMFFPRQNRLRGVEIAVAHKNCVYVAVESFGNDVNEVGNLCYDVENEVGDLCYDVERNVWKPAVLFRVSPARMGLYHYCFTSSLFVVNDVMYKVVVYVTNEHRYDRPRVDRPHPTVQILARSLAVENNGGAWAEIASTVLPHRKWEMKWVGPWYACTLGGHEKPTICKLYFINHLHDAILYMMKYDVGKSTWKKVCLTNAENNLQSLDDFMGCSKDARPTLNERIEQKWKTMRMVPNYTPSWICPARECTHHHSLGHGRAHVGVV